MLFFCFFLGGGVLIFFCLFVCLFFGGEGEVVGEGGGGGGLFVGCAKDGLSVGYSCLICLFHRVVINGIHDSRKGEWRRREPVSDLRRDHGSVVALRPQCRELSLTNGKLGIQTYSHVCRPTVSKSLGPSRLWTPGAKKYNSVVVYGRFRSQSLTSLYTLSPTPPSFPQPQVLFAFEVFVLHCYFRLS